MEFLLFVDPLKFTKRTHQRGCSREILLLLFDEEFQFVSSAWDK